jgi:L-histidine N-alpha-methyltransferase
VLTSGQTASRELSRGFCKARVQNGNSVLEATAGTLDPTMEFAQSLVEGLACRPRRVDCRFLYDATGSELYERITEQPEYYLTRTEASILARHSEEIAGITGPVTLVELGSGSSVKTDYLLTAYLRQLPSLCYVPVDVSASALARAGRAISKRHSGARVIGIHGTYQQAFSLFPTASPVMVLFLGSTIGNLAPGEASHFLEQIARNLAPGDFFLLGLDLVKARPLLEAAYNDGAGVTAAFTRNLFARMNRELGSALDLSSIDHLARYNARREQIEIHARFNRAQTLHIRPLNRSFAIPAGGKILTEISRKFHIKKMQALLESFGMRTNGIFVDKKRWFASLLMQKNPLPTDHR